MDVRNETLAWSGGAQHLPDNIGDALWSESELSAKNLFCNADGEARKIRACAIYDRFGVLLGIDEETDRFSAGLVEGGFFEAKSFGLSVFEVLGNLGLDRFKARPSPCLDLCLLCLEDVDETRARA